MSIRSFDNFEEMMADMRQNEQAANERTLPLQREVVYGDYWVAYNEYMQLWLFGRVWTREESLKGAIDAGASVAEAEEEMSSLDDAYGRGYRFGTVYSVACPDGEIGDTHISTILGKLSELEFVAARDREWDLPQVVDAGVDLLRLIRENLAEENIRREKAGEDPISL